MKPESPEDRSRYHNYPAKPAVQVLEELLAKVCDLESIPMRCEGQWSGFLMAEDYKDKQTTTRYVCSLRAAVPMHY
jgi:hypothetical protein